MDSGGRDKLPTPILRRLSPLDPAVPLTTPSSQQSKRLLDLFVALAAPRPLADVLDTILVATTEVLGCGRASMLLYDASAGSLRFVAATNEEAEALAQIPVPLDGSLAGEVFRERRPLVAGDVASDERHFAAPGEALGYSPQAIAAVPLLVAGDAIGVLEALDPADGTFSETDVRLLEAIAAQAAVAVHVARERFDAERARARLAARDRLSRSVLHALARAAADEDREAEAGLLALACRHLDATTQRAVLAWTPAVAAAIPAGAAPPLDLCGGALSVAADATRLADVLRLAVEAALGRGEPDALDVCVAEDQGLAQVEVRGPGVGSPRADLCLSVAALIAERDGASVAVVDGAVVVSLPRAS